MQMKCRIKITAASASSMGSVMCLNMIRKKGCGNVKHQDNIHQPEMRRLAAVIGQEALYQAAPVSGTEGKDAFHIKRSIRGNRQNRESAP